MDHRCLVNAWAATRPGEALERLTLVRPPLGPREIKIEVGFVGICHSDLNLIDGDWGDESVYPQVCGHEIVGIVTDKGPNVERFVIGQRVGVGWQAGSCLQCESCLRGDEQLCHEVRTACSKGQTGGFADVFYCEEDFAFMIPEEIASPEAAPLLCAGITVYAALEPRVRPGRRIAVAGIGGLGHLAIQFASKMGCDVTAITTSERKRDDAIALGANAVLSTDDLATKVEAFDLVLVTSGSDYDWSALLRCLRPRGELCFAGMPQPFMLDVASLIARINTVSTANIGGRAMMSRMFDFARRYNVRPTIEVLGMHEINDAVARLRRNDATYRLVLANPPRAAGLRS